MTARIERIEITHHRLPLDPPFVAAWDSRPRTQFDATIVRVWSEGQCGIGSGDLMVGFAGHEDLFVGEPVFAFDRHFRVLENIAFHYGRCWPLDIALWDLAGKLAGQPVWRLLGGRQRELALYASTGARRDAEAMADKAEEVLSEGFPAMKIRLRPDGWAEDLRGLEAARARVGDRLHLMVDCNQGWRMPWDTGSAWSLKDALGRAEALRDLRVYWMEEPLHWSDTNGMAALRAASGPLRIAGGEMTRDMASQYRLLEAGALDVYQADAALVGGLTGLKAFGEACERQGAVFTPHTWTNGLGFLANAHLCGGIGNPSFLEFPYDLPDWSLPRRDYMLADPVVAANGRLTLGETPGLGVSLDEDRLAKTRI